MMDTVLEQPEGYHWIAKTIDQLDPETDYETIWRLMTSYHLGDFMNNLVYSLTFPNFIVTPHGANAVWREDGGKVLNKATLRVEETENNNATWWWYGPSDPRARKSIAGINALHAKWAKVYPGHFSYNEDYVYTLAFSAILMHRLRLRLGLSGFTEKEKIAAHHFWRDMSQYFVVEGGAPVHGFPKDWDDAIKFCEDFEHAPREGTEQGHLIAQAIYEHFSFRYFPSALRWLGKSIPMALSLPTTLKTLKIKPVNPILAACIVWFVGTMMWLAETLLPDPKDAFWPAMEAMDEEQRRTRNRMMARVDKKYAPYFKSRHQNEWPGCPYHMALRSDAPAKI